MGYKINERNSGIFTMDGRRKIRPTKITKEELAKEEVLTIGRLAMIEREEVFEAEKAKIKEKAEELASMAWRLYYEFAATYGEDCQECREFTNVALNADNIFA